MAVTGMTISSYRDRVVDFTLPFYYDPSAVAIHLPSPSLYYLFKPLKPNVWMCIFIMGKIKDLQNFIPISQKSGLVLRKQESAISNFRTLVIFVERFPTFVMNIFSVLLIGFLLAIIEAVLYRGDTFRSNRSKVHFHTIEGLWYATHAILAQCKCSHSKFAVKLAHPQSTVSVHRTNLIQHGTEW